jgi:hypothetical protein
MTKHAATTTTVSEMSVAELQTRAEKARGLVAQIAELLPGLIHMSVDERKHTNGKFQAGEVPAMKKLLTAAGKHPQLFSALADKDGGKDAKTFEPQPAIDDLDRIAALQDLGADVETLAQTLTDTLLSFGTDAREVGVPVHAIISANKSVAPALASDAADGMEFYAGHGRAASRTRAKAKAKAAAAAGATATPTK